MASFTVQLGRRSWNVSGPNLRFQNWVPIRDAKMASMLSALTVSVKSLWKMQFQSPKCKCWNLFHLSLQGFILGRFLLSFSQCNSRAPDWIPARSRVQGVSKHLCPGKMVSHRFWNHLCAWHGFFWSSWPTAQSKATKKKSDLEPKAGLELGPKSDPELGPKSGPELEPKLGPELGPKRVPELKDPFWPDFKPLFWNPFRVQFWDQI